MWTLLHKTLSSYHEEEFLMFPFADLRGHKEETIPHSGRIWNLTWGISHNGTSVPPEILKKIQLVAPLSMWGLVPNFQDTTDAPQKKTAYIQVRKEQLFIKYF